MRAKNTLCCWLPTAVILFSPAAALRAQSLDDLNPISHQRGGLHLYGASIDSSYYSSPYYAGAAIPVGFGNLQSDASVGGSASLGWTHYGDRSTFAITYSPSYTGRVRYTDLNALSQSLDLNASRKLNQKWTVGFSANAGVSNFDQFLFSPTVFGGLVSAPATFDDLTKGVLAGKYTNDQLASLLTGAPVVESPAQFLFYGNRMFTSSARTSLSYAHSQRLSFTFGLEGARSQHLSDNVHELGRNTYLVPRTTNGGVSLGLSYSLSPRTVFGFSASSNRTYSTLQDAYNSSASLSLGRILGRRWFVQLQGGAGRIDPVRQTYLTSRGTQAVGGANLGYKTYAHTFMASYQRAISDVYGIGATATLSMTGAWHWARPGRNWWTDATFGQQQMLGTGLSSLDSWRATAGFGRMLTRHMAVQMQYAYASYSTEALSNAFYHDMTQHAVRVSLAWRPEQIESAR
jgi:hypothetical protein